MFCVPPGKVLECGFPDEEGRFYRKIAETWEGGGAQWEGKKIAEHEA